MFWVTSIVVFDRAAAMIILVGDAAIGATVAFEMDVTSAKITSVGLLDASFMSADARVANHADARVAIHADARVAAIVDARVP